MSQAFLSSPHGRQESQSPNSSHFLSTFSLVLEQIDVHGRSEHAQSADTHALWDRPLLDRAGAAVLGQPCQGDHARRPCQATVSGGERPLSAFRQTLSPPSHTWKREGNRKGNVDPRVL